MTHKSASSENESLLELQEVNNNKHNDREVNGRRKSRNTQDNDDFEENNNEGTKCKM